MRGVRWTRAWPWFAVVLRLGVGAVWIVAGALKLSDLDSSVRAVRAYRVLPDALEAPIGLGLPILEVCIGALLVLGLTTRLAAAVSTLLFAAFIIGIAQAWARGLQIDCGCFGGGGDVEGDVTWTYVWEIGRDTALLAASIALVPWPRTPLGLDSILFPEPTREVVEEERVET